MSATTSNPRRAAENALWHALEERRDTVRAAGLGFSERQHHQFRQEHDAGNLIARLCAAMENYKGNEDPRYMRAMAQVLKRGLPTWEDVLIKKGAPWAPYVAAAARRGAQKCIAGARGYIPFL